MKYRLFGLLLLLTLIISALSSVFPSQSVNTKKLPDVFVGVDIAYGDVNAVKELADEVSSYTNLFVLGCTGVTQNKLKLEESCQYLFEKGLFFVVYQEYPIDSSWHSIGKSDWVEKAKTRWGNQFLGIYYTDEVGGRQLDHVPNWMSVEKASSYADANTQFNNGVGEAVNWFRNGYSGGNDICLFTSDYGLYWFDYQAGYDVILAQFGWNYSRQLNIGLCRGAATALDKEWGAMITWTYKQPPYIESGEELYNDLLLAYDNGAKYIMVFNSNEEYLGGILEQEHLDALKEFWQYSQLNPRKAISVIDRVAYVLPEDYAYGFRGPNDKIWGLWEADTLSTPISSHLGSILEQYGFKLDIIYEDAIGIGDIQGYRSFFYWNSSSTEPGRTLPAPRDTASPETPLEGFSYIDLPIVLAFAGVTLAVSVGSIVLVRRRWSEKRVLVAKKANQ